MVTAGSTPFGGACAHALTLTTAPSTTQRTRGCHIRRFSRHMPPSFRLVPTSVIRQLNRDGASSEYCRCNAMTGLLCGWSTDLPFHGTTQWQWKLDCIHVSVSAGFSWEGK